MVVLCWEPYQNGQEVEADYVETYGVNKCIVRKDSGQYLKTCCFSLTMVDVVRRIKIKKEGT